MEMPRRFETETSGPVAAVLSEANGDPNGSHDWASSSLIESSPDQRDLKKMKTWKAPMAEVVK